MSQFCRPQQLNRILNEQTLPKASTHMLQTLETNPLGSICLYGENHKNRSAVCNLLALGYEEPAIVWAKCNQKHEGHNPGSGGAYYIHGTTYAIPATGTRNCSYTAARDRAGGREESSRFATVPTGNRPSKQGRRRGSGRPEHSGRNIRPDDCNDQWY